MQISRTHLDHSAVYPYPATRNLMKRYLKICPQLYLPPEMDCGKVMFSVVSVCPQGGGSHVTTTWNCSNLFTWDPSQPLRCPPPHHHSYPPMARRHVETCTLGPPHIGTYHLEPAGSGRLAFDYKTFLFIVKLKKGSSLSRSISLSCEPLHLFTGEGS